MPSISRLNRLAIAVALVLGVGLGIAAAPLWRSALIAFNQAHYGDLTYRCDSAMRSHHLAKAEAVAAPSAESVDAIRRSELALIDCQDYDLLQKRLTVWGLRESDLGLMRLKAIEADANGLRQVVEAHEIRD
jgi:hypothetical protein